MSETNNVQELIKEYEANGDFDKHLNPIDNSMVIKVDGSYHYKKHFFEWLKYRLEELFIVIPYTYYINKRVTRTTVIGREKLKGISSAIVTCNHVYLFDCLVVRRAVKGHRLYSIAAPFNNMKGFLGEMMRAGNMLPLSEEFDGMRNFNKNLAERLAKEKYVLFYPEQAMWWLYEKPRPLKRGAFFYAVKNKVPVIPCFITYERDEKKGNAKVDYKKFTVNIMDPIYAKPELSQRENEEYMMQENYNRCKSKYEEIYEKKLVYDRKPKEGENNENNENL